MNGIEFDFECAECGVILIVRTKKIDHRGRIEVAVSRCHECLENEYELGKEAGRKEVQP